MRGAWKCQSREKIIEPVSGTFAGVQLAALFQLLFVGTAFQVCAELKFGHSTIPHKTAIEEASIRAGLALVKGLAVFAAVVV